MYRYVYTMYRYIDMMYRYIDMMYRYIDYLYRYIDYLYRYIGTFVTKLTILLNSRWFLPFRGGSRPVRIRTIGS